LVQEGITTGWDDPRMPTISGLRRKGYTPTSIKNFIERVGVAKERILLIYNCWNFCKRRP
jgi:glutaminyl-tRNA synthetase